MQIILVLNYLLTAIIANGYILLKLKIKLKREQPKVP